MLNLDFSQSCLLTNPRILTVITMLDSYVFIFLIGLISIWLGFKISEEVYSIAVVLSGVVVLVTGLALAPSFVQMGVLLLTGLCCKDVWQAKDPF